MTTTMARVCGHEAGDVRLPDGSLTCFACYMDQVNTNREEAVQAAAREDARLHHPEIFCSVTNCWGDRVAKSMCWKHYTQSRRRRGTVSV